MCHRILRLKRQRAAKVGNRIFKGTVISPSYTQIYMKSRDLWIDFGSPRRQCDRKVMPSGLNGYYPKPMKTFSVKWIVNKYFAEVSFSPI